MANQAVFLDRDIDLNFSIMVGDRWKDIEAELAAQCYTVFVDRGYAEQESPEAHFVCASLLESVPWILNKKRKGMND